MALRGVKLTSVQKRLKFMMYGAAGVGKTTAAISFPAPYLIDTEKGCENEHYEKILNANGGVVFRTNDYDEILKEIKELMTTQHDYKTLIIDQMTVIYNTLLDQAELALGKNNGFGKHYMEANKKIKNLLHYITRLDMNVIFITQEKNEYGNDMSVIGQTFDCYKKLDYFFDLVLRIQMRGKERVAIVRKSRLEAFEQGGTIPFRCEDIINRYGSEIITKTSSNEKLATPEQVAHLKHLIDLYKEPEENVNKWLEKAQSECLEDMNEEIIKKIIVYMENKTKKEETNNAI